MKRAFLVLPVIIVISGCAYLRSDTRRSVTTSRDPFVTNSFIVTVEEKTKARGWTMLDANASLAKFSNRSGYATNSTGSFAPGTYATGINETSSASNVVAILQAIATGVAAGLK